MRGHTARSLACTCAKCCGTWFASAPHRDDTRHGCSSVGRRAENPPSGRRRPIRCSGHIGERGTCHTRGGAPSYVAGQANVAQRPRPSRSGCHVESPLAVATSIPARLPLRRVRRVSPAWQLRCLPRWSECSLSPQMKRRLVCTNAGFHWKRSASAGSRSRRRCKRTSTTLGWSIRARKVGRATLVVLQCLSDMATDISLADAPDVSRACLWGVQGGGQGEWYCPFALQVPGVRSFVRYQCQGRSRATDVVPRVGRPGQGCVPVGAFEATPSILAKPSATLVRRRARVRQCGVQPLCGLPLQSVCKCHARLLTHARRFPPGLRYVAHVRLRDPGHCARAGVPHGSPSDMFSTQCAALHTIVNPVSALSLWVRRCQCREAGCLARGDRG